MTDEFIDGLPVTTTIADGDLLITEMNPDTVDAITKGIEWSSLQNLIMNFQSYQIVPSVSSNNLTVAIKYIDGNDASTTKPIKIRVGNTIFSLAAAASVTKNAGTNWCNLGGAELAGFPTDLFVYAIAETGASAGLKFGFSRIPYARTMNDFVNTNTSEKYIAGNWTNFNTSDLVSNIGRFRAQLSAGAGYTWSIASQLVINRPIYESDPLSYAGQAAAVTGSITTLGTVAYTYHINQKVVFVTHDVNITTNGTGAAFVSVKTPFTCAVQTSNYGRENGTGRTLNGLIVGSNNIIYYAFYDGSYPGANNRELMGEGSYSI
jgi:hypothetical protein